MITNCHLLDLSERQLRNITEKQTSVLGKRIDLVSNIDALYSQPAFTALRSGEQVDLLSAFYSKAPHPHDCLR